MQSTSNRYSAAELEEFRLLINKKIEVSLEQIKNMESQINDIHDDEDDHGTDLMDDSNNSSNLELLNSMVHRQKQHIRDLENALIRIKNKSYGICVITGELIDKRRLMAVLTTTKSLQGKTIEAMPPEKRPAPNVKKTTTPQSFTRIIKKTPPAGAAENKIKDDFLDDDDDDDDNDDYDNDEINDLMEDDSYIDPDSLSDDDL